MTLERPEVLVCLKKQMRFWSEKYLYWPMKGKTTTFISIQTRHYELANIPFRQCLHGQQCPPLPGGSSISTMQLHTMRCPSALRCHLHWTLHNYSLLMDNGCSFFSKIENKWRKVALNLYFKKQTTLLLRVVNIANVAQCMHWLI